MSVTEQVTAFQRKRVADHEVLDLVALDMPAERFATQALWYELPEQALADDFPLDVLQGSLHAAEHAQIAVLPLIAMCDRWDIGGLSTAFHAQTGRPTVFIYDGHPGGVGITRMGFERFERLVRGRHPADRRVPLREGLPLLRAVAQVREPQRAAEQERGARAAAPACTADCRPVQGSALCGRHDEGCAATLPLVALLALATPAVGRQRRRGACRRRNGP